MVMSISPGVLDVEEVARIASNYGSITGDPRVLGYAPNAPKWRQIPQQNHQQLV